MAEVIIRFNDGTKAEFEVSEDYAIKRYFGLRDILEQFPKLGRYKEDGK